MAKKTKSKTKSLDTTPSFSKPLLIGFALIFAAIGGYAVYRSFAAGGGTSLNALYAIEDSASSATKVPATTCAQLSSQAANPTAREVDVSAMTCPGQINFSANPSSTVKYVFASGVKFTGGAVGNTLIAVYVSGSNLILWGPADVTNPSDDGIRVEGANNIVIGGGIKTHDNGTQGILVQQESNNVWLDGVESTNNGTHAACVSSGLCTGAEPNYDLSGDHGIYWGDGTVGGGVVNSYIHDQPNGYCIEVYQGNNSGSNSIFAFNTLARCTSPGEVGGDSGGLGVYLYDGGSNQTFVGNVITGTRFAALGSHSTSGTAKGNVFWNTGTQGDIYNDSAPNLTVSDSHDLNPQLDSNDRPQASSPLTNIDSAYASTYLPRTDFTGATRTTADAGAFVVPGSGGGGTDTTPPTVSISSPSGGSIVSGATAVTASASDDTGVASVQFKLDGSNLGSLDTSSPYSVSWDTTTTTAGSHSLTAVAKDAAGNTTTSSTVTVTVSNGGGGSTTTFGTTTPGSGVDTATDGFKVTSLYTVPQAGSITKISGYISGLGAGSGSQTLKAVLYSNSGGTPSALLSTSNQVTVTAGQAWGWVDFTFPGAVAVSSGSIWMGYIASTTSDLTQLAYSTVTSEGHGNANTGGYAAGPTNPFGAPLIDDFHYSIYATLNTGTTTVPGGDTNNDNHVTLTDLTNLLANWGTNNTACDFNNDGTVSGLDLSILLSHYGT